MAAEKRYEMNKVYASAEKAIADIGDGAVIAIGGFFAAGVPRILLGALAAEKVTGLTLACGSGPLLGAKEIAKMLIANKQIRKVIDSYALSRSMSSGMSDPLEQKIRSGEIELEIFPMGTLAEKYRAAGAGIAAFYTPVRCRDDCRLRADIQPPRRSSDQRDAAFPERRICARIRSELRLRLRACL